jgi:hypothetical protein
MLPAAGFVTLVILISKGVMKNTKFLIALITIFITSCAESAQPTNTSVPVNETPLTIATSNLPIDFQCPEISTKFPDSVESGGRVILKSYKNGLSSLDPTTGLKTQIPDSRGWIGDGVVSPNGKMLAYPLSYVDKDEYFVAFADANNNVIKSVPLQDNWYMIGNWINNDQLAILAFDQQMILLSPYSDQQQTIDTVEMGFPDYSNYDLIQPWVYFDPSLIRAVYAATSSEIIVSAVENQKPLARIPWWTAELTDASWSQDGKYVAIVGRNPKHIDNNSGMEELYIINRDGIESRMSQFADYYENGADLYHPVWSPNGKYIAVWMYNTSYDNLHHNLVILDANAKIVTSYCVSSNLFTGPTGDWLRAPIWSPNSKQVVVENYYNETKNRVVIVDITNHIAVQIAQNARPVGWMDKSP